MKKKKELIIILGSLLVVVLSVSIAYFTTTINSKNSNVSTSSAELKIVFTSGTGTIAGAEIEPGWSSGVNTFTVKNQSNSTYKYNLVIKDLINTFVTTGYLQYKITSTDGGYNMSDFKDVPKSETATDEVLAYSVEIAKGATHTYSVEFRYLNSTTVNQNEDMGKKLSGTLFIEEGTTESIPLYNKILADNANRATRDSISGALTDTTTGTLYTATEKNIHNTTDTTVYYYAGNTTNNWVYFAGYYWRIIRTNADGSIRLLYSGTATNTIDATIGSSVYNTSYNDPMYVGYMYGDSGSLESNRKNTNNSTTKTVVDNWYKGNLEPYTSYLSTTAVYCNDRTLSSGATYSTTSSFTYLKSTNTTTYDCMTAEDAFSASNLSAKLTYPIALMTQDEVRYAGGWGGADNPTVWYNLNSDNKGIVSYRYYWGLMTPNRWDGTYANRNVVSSYNNQGRIYYDRVSNNRAVRPVISLKGNTIYKSGEGTSSSPYQVKMEENNYILRLTKGTGISKIYYKLDGDSSYTSSTTNSTFKVNNGSKYYYYGEASTGYTISTCTESNPCSVEINSTFVNKTINATINKYEVTLAVVNGSGGGTKTINYGSSASFTITPDSGYALTANSDSCGGKFSGDVYMISDIKSAMSCSITLEKAMPLYDKILADNPTIQTRSSFSAVFTTTNTGTLYKATESIVNGTAKDVYYFAGNAKNNWVKFANFYWRIIRTNHDGSVRLLYSGTATDTTSGYIGASTFNSSYKNPMYVGYMYGTTGNLASNRTNENNSTIKGVIDTWYSNNLSSYSKYISTEAVYCNDRGVGSGTYSATGSTFYYAPYTRLHTNKTPTYNCTNIKDAFSGSNSEAKLTYPIGLMTADEVAYAGGKSEKSLISPYAWYYLNSAGGSITGSTYWWLLSPYYWNDINASSWSMRGSGNPGRLYYGGVNASNGVRPAISLKTCALWTSGNGAPETPYEISTTSGC